MSVTNYCLLKINKIHEELYDELTENNLFMEKLSDKYEIHRIMRKLILNNISISENTTKQQ